MLYIIIGTMLSGVKIMAHYNNYCEQIFLGDSMPSQKDLRNIITEAKNSLEDKLGVKINVVNIQRYISEEYLASK